MIQNLLTIDVEDWFHVLDAPDSEGQQVPWDTLPSRVVANTHRIIDILDNYDVKATFFVLGWVADRYPALVRTIAARGHDIASHGYGHVLVNRLSPAAFEADLVRSLHAITQSTGKAVTGYRAAGFSVTPAQKWVFPILNKHGIQYDASIFPAHHGHGGYPGAPHGPFLLQNPDNSVIYEFPASVVNFLGYPIPIGGGGYLRLFPSPVIGGAIRYLNQAAESATLYLHPRELDPDQPRLSGLSLFRRFKYYVNLRQTEGKFNDLLTQFSFTSIERFLQNDYHRGCLNQKRHVLGAL